MTHDLRLARRMDRILTIERGVLRDTPRRTTRAALSADSAGAAPVEHLAPQMNSSTSQPQIPHTTAHTRQPIRNGCHRGPRPCCTQSQLRRKPNRRTGAPLTAAPTR